MDRNPSSLLATFTSATHCTQEVPTLATPCPLFSPIHLRPRLPLRTLLPVPGPLPFSSPASPSSSAPSFSASDDPAFVQGLEAGRLSTYRELEDYIARTEGEKRTLEEQLRKAERQLEEDRLRGLKGEVMAVEAVKRRTGLKGGVCEEETRRVLSCYRANMAQVLRCDGVMREFVMCADAAKDEAVLRARAPHPVSTNQTIRDTKA